MDLSLKLNNDVSHLLIDFVGCFEHYATLRQHDANFARFESANEWLLTYDMLSSSMFSDNEFALYPYLSYTLAPFYPLFQARGSQRIERNYSDWEVSFFFFT